jgi:hypothetical protein
MSGKLSAERSGRGVAAAQPVDAKQAIAARIERAPFSTLLLPPALALGGADAAVRGNAAKHDHQWRVRRPGALPRDARTIQNQAGFERKRRWQCELAFEPVG